MRRQIFHIGAHGGGGHNHRKTRGAISGPGLARRLRDFSSFPAHGVGKRLTSQHQHGIARNNQHFELTANRMPAARLDRTLEAKSRFFLPSPSLLSRHSLPALYRHRHPYISSPSPPTQRRARRLTAVLHLDLCACFFFNSKARAVCRRLLVQTDSTYFSTRFQTVARDDGTWWINTGLRDTESPSGTTLLLLLTPTRVVHLPSPLL